MLLFILLYKPANYIKLNKIIIIQGVIFFSFTHLYIVAPVKNSGVYSDRGTDVQHPGHQVPGIHDVVPLLLLHVVGFADYAEAIVD